MQQGGSKTKVTLIRPLGLGMSLTADSNPDVQKHLKHFGYGESDIVRELCECMITVTLLLRVKYGIWLTVYI